MEMLAKEFPMLTFRYRKDLSKKEINEALKEVDSYLGQTLFVENARIIPDGGLIEVKDDNGNWRVVVVSEAGDRIISPNNCMWLTSLDNEKRHQPIKLVKKYEGNEKDYPFYDNYCGINVNKTQDIPADYMGGQWEFLLPF